MGDVKHVLQQLSTIDSASLMTSQIISNVGAQILMEHGQDSAEALDEVAKRKREARSDGDQDMVEFWGGVQSYLMDEASNKEISVHK